jgi:hypothetical protein
MEGCVPLTTGPIFSFIVLFSLLLGLFILFRRLDAVILAMAQASQPSETFCSLANKETQHDENNTSTKNNDNTIFENASPKSFSLGPVYSEKTAVVVLNPRKCSNILDRHLDDIRVPTLQPKTPQKRIHLAVTDPNQLRTVSLQRTASDVLLDAGIEDLMIPVLEPERVSDLNVIAGCPTSDNSLPRNLWSLLVYAGIPTSRSLTDQGWTPFPGMAISAGP